jgi:hypothetical protein
VFCEHRGHQRAPPDQQLSTALQFRIGSGANKPLLGTLGPSRYSRLNGYSDPQRPRACRSPRWITAHRRITRRRGTVRAEWTRGRRSAPDNQ